MRFTYATQRNPNSRANRLSMNVVLTLILSVVTAPQAAWVNGQQGTIVYSVFVPSNYSATTKYPLIMHMHGVGDRGNNHVNLQDQDLVILSSDSSQAKYPCILYAPQCPTTDQWVAVTGWTEVNYNIQAMPPTNAWLDALKGLDTVIAKYSIDTNRVYSVGGSMGGYGTWYTISKYPKRFAAAIPIAGGGDTAAAAGFANMPLWAFHGTNDAVVPVAGSRTMTAAMRKAGGSPRYTEYSTAQIGQNGYSSYGDHIYFLPIPLEPTLRDWLFGQVKGKAIVTLSQSSVSATFMVGQPKTNQITTITAANTAPSRIHITGQYTVTKKSPWLSVAINTSNLDSQVITNTIDPSSLPDAVAKYYDTVTVHAANGEVADMTYLVQVWIRQSPVLTSIVLTPGSSQAAIGQDIQFTAKVLDQYGVDLSPTPSLTWTATGDGTVNTSGLFAAGTCLGSSAVTVSTSGSTANAGVTVFTLDYARGAILSASSVSNGGPLSGMVDGVVGGYPNTGTQEWSSSVEKAGAWAKLTWLLPVTIDSIALWDRPNTSDQVTSGSLTFSDGSSITVGALPNDATTPWAVKFAAKTITWIKFTVNSVSSTTYAVGLAEFEVFNSASCASTTTQQSEARTEGQELFRVSARKISVDVPSESRWSIALFSLDGTRLGVHTGRGPETFSPAIHQADGFVVAKFRSGSNALVEKVLLK